MKTQPKNVDPESLRKVRAYMEAHDRVQQFKEQHFEIFQQFAHLLRQYNDALEDAEKEVRARGINCGPFTVCGEMVRIDVEKLYDELGEEDFLKSGGSMETKRVLSINRKKFEALVDSGAIPKEVAETCFTRTLKYKAPNKAEMP